MTADIHTRSYYCERPGCIRAQRDELRDRLEAVLAQRPAAPSNARGKVKVGDAQQPASVGEEIMVNTPYDVFILPLQPSGLDGNGPRFVVHVPLIEAPAVKALQAEVEAQESECPPTGDEVVFFDGVGAGRSSVKSCRDGVQCIRVGDRVYWPLSESDAKRLHSACCGNGSFDGPATPAGEGEQQ